MEARGAASRDTTVGASRRHGAEAGSAPPSAASTARSLFGSIDPDPFDGEPAPALARKVRARVQ